MAKGKKIGGRNLQPGQSGNPRGRPKAYADLVRELRTGNETGAKEIIRRKLLAGDALYLKLAIHLLDGRPAVRG